MTSSLAYVLGPRRPRKLMGMIHEIDMKGLDFEREGDRTITENKDPRRRDEKRHDGLQELGKCLRQIQT